MTDRELLELAAVAAGIAGEWIDYYGSGDYYYKGNTDGVFYSGDGGVALVWNPLTDDGDALRLAVALNLHAMRSCANRIVCYKEKYPFDADIPGNDVWKEISDCWFPSAPTKSAAVAVDQLSATRRAIVRAAAEIGKAMQ